ncbi:MAG: UvrD-helicase domain-containing protein [Planctomycetota bacterium]
MGKTRDELLEELNPAQREAVAHMEGALMVLAGAGSGKTRVITHRIAHLLRSGVQSDSVLAITFTNKAASEMKERTEQLCGSSSPWVSTFHSFSARLLRRHAYRIEPYDSSFTVCDRDDCKALVKTILKEQNIDSQLWDPAGLLSSISKIKNVQQGDDALLGSDYKHGQVLRDLYNLYTEAMRERNLLDFDDLLLLSVQLLEENEDLLERYQEQFQYILIDEYQDTNAVQYRISSLLAKSHGNLCITGDPDQSIYHWRGADINNILNFEKDYPGARIILLEQNYRSTGNILSTANALISRNIERKPKDLWTENPAGNPVRVYRFLNELEEAREIADLIDKLIKEGTPCGDIAIFYRLNAFSRALEQELIYSNIPYAIVGGVEFFLRKEIKDLLGFLRIMNNPRDSESLKRIINVPPRGIGKGTIERIAGVAGELGKSLLETTLSEELESYFTGRQQKAIARFRKIYRKLEEARAESVEELLLSVLQETGYDRLLDGMGNEESQERKANIGELVGAATEYDRNYPDGSLTGFLELTALLGDVDRWDRREDRVSLMTLHSAKGLEFPVVTIAGVEDGVLPLLRSDDAEPDIEEERRLLFVGITRAKEMLYLTHTNSRQRFGQILSSVPSRFLNELSRPTDENAAHIEMDAKTQTSLHGPGLRRSGFGQPPQEDFPGDIDPFSNEDPFGDFFDEAEDPYQPGAVVAHEEYGEGEIVRTNGFGERRRVTVRFEEAGEKQFVIAHANLRVIREPMDDDFPGNDP